MQRIRNESAVMKDTKTRTMKTVAFNWDYRSGDLLVIFNENLCRVFVQSGSGRKVSSSLGFRVVTSTIIYFDCDL